MNLSISRGLAGVLAAATIVSALPANAGERWRGHDHRRPIVVERHVGGGDLLAAGVLGLATGAIIAGIASQPQPIYREPVYRYPPAYPQPGPDRRYFPPAPAYEQPYPVRAYGGYEPWTREWFRYCSDRYRSFDASSGTFMGYDGIRRFCVAN